MTNSKSTFVASFLALTFLAKVACASGLMVTPSRIEFKGDAKSNEVKLINRGDETSTYRISFQNLRMKKDGTYEEIKESDGKEKFAENLIRYSPKQVTLKPGEVQTVRLMVSRPANLEVGEYRSHLLLKEEAPADFGNNVEKQATSDKNISVILKPLFAISIPVIIQNGAVEANASLASLELKTVEENEVTKKFLAVEIARVGNASIYTNSIVTFTPKDSKAKYEIGSVNNVGVLYPYDSRVINVALNIPKDVELAGGTIEVKLYASKDVNASDDEKPRLLSQKTLAVN